VHANAVLIANQNKAGSFGGGEHLARWQHCCRAKTNQAKFKKLST